MLASTPELNCWTICTSSDTPGLMRMYADFEQVLAESRADAVIVDNCPPYHPDYLRKLPFYKVLRVADGPLAAYDRDLAYLHAYDQVLYHSPAYSRDMGMAEKLRYCGKSNCDFWPLGLFDALHDPSKSEAEVFSRERDVDVVFIGGLYAGKMPLLARLKKTFGRRFRLHGLTNWKKNAYFNVKHGFPGWLTPLAFEQYVPLYQRAKIGINIHNRGDYTVGSYRLFDLPGNGVMQISDGGPYLDDFFKAGEEIIGYSSADDLIDKVRYYLDNDEERNRIALNGYRAVMLRHRMAHRMEEAGNLISLGMTRIAWHGTQKSALSGAPVAARGEFQKD